jgi:hypothetical protein
MDEEILMAIPMNCATQHRDRGRPESPASILDIKQEPLSSPSSPSSDEDASSAISVGGNESPIHMPEHTFIKQEPQPMSRVSRIVRVTFGIKSHTQGILASMLTVSIVSNY